MRLRNRYIPQAGTGANSDGESRPRPSGLGCPSYSGGGNESHQAAQSSTAAEQSHHLSPSSSPTISLFSSVPSSPQSFADLHQSFSSSSSLNFSSPLRAEDVVQKAPAADITAPVQGIRRTRKSWTRDMNIFIMRHYFILTKLETNMRSYLTPLHSLFTTKYPEIEASKQRIGDQRRAIVHRNLLTKQELLEVKAEAEQLLQNQQASVDINAPQAQTHRMQWSNDLNELIIKSYYRITKLETDFTIYRTLLHQEIISKRPELSHLSVQRIADQRRSIVNNRLISLDRLNRIKEEVRSEQDSNRDMHNIEEIDTDVNTNEPLLQAIVDSRQQMQQSNTNPQIIPEITQSPNTLNSNLSLELALQFDKIL